MGRIGAVMRWLRRLQPAEREESAPPGQAAYHYEQAAHLHAKGDLAAAATHYRRALDLDPAHLGANVDLSALLLQADEPAQAEINARSALRIDPGTVAAYVNLGSALEAQARLAEAAACYCEALALDTACTPAHCGLSSVCIKQDRLEAARDHALAALESDGECVDALVSLGNVYLRRGPLEMAVAALRDAIRLRPDSAIGHFSLGYALELDGALDDAMRCHDIALSLEPDSVQAHVNRAANLLLREDYALGWPEYEWRLRSRENRATHERFSIPRWDGSRLEGRALLVYAEQGLGDEILYASCLPEVIARAGRCVIDCDPRLAPIFRRSFPTAIVHGGRQDEPSHWLKDMEPMDFAIPTASLPLYLRRSAADFPAHTGYLRARQEGVRNWHDRLRALGAGLKVGLSWQGGTAQTGRFWRSVALERMLPILRQRNVSFVSLQYGDDGGEPDRLRRAHGPVVHHWPDALADYDETAALVSALDLTLSVCTAVVHLAGALGRPVWVLAPLRPESRYGFRGSGMRWYPSTRVFRQPARGDWDSVIRQVAGELARLAG